MKVQPVMRVRRARAMRGFSLIELMIALVVGLVVSGAVLAFTLASMKSNSEYILSTRLTQELRNSMDLVTRDLRRAGYDETSLQYVATGNATPFSRMKLCNSSGACNTATTAGTVLATAPITCAIYAYDRAPGGTPGVVDLGNGEVRGMRLKQRTYNGRSVGVIEYAVSAGTLPACDDASPDYTTYPPACTGAWCALSDPAKLDITALAFVDNGTVVGTSPTQVQIRDLTINMTGRLAGSSEFTRQITSDVRIRSDCFDKIISNCALAP
jgi:prepilin-type N-terminal cleavage/methylation domain-containing protein